MQASHFNRNKYYR